MTVTPYEAKLAMEPYFDAIRGAAGYDDYQRLARELRRALDRACELLEIGTLR